MEGTVTKNFLKYLQNTGLTKNILRVGQKAVAFITNVSYSVKIPRACPLTLGDGVSFLPYSDHLAEVKVSQHVDAEKCD